MGYGVWGIRYKGRARRLRQNIPYNLCKGKEGKARERKGREGKGSKIKKIYHTI